MDFEIRLLRCALTLAEHRNFARAAEALHLSQPSLSRSIQSLERQAGVLIFERGSRRVEVTDAGEIFLEHAREVMAQSSDLSREMELLKGLGKGELQVGVGTYVGVEYVDRAVGRIVRQHPEVRLRITNDNWTNLVPLLHRRELDLAVISVPGLAADADLHVTPLARRQGYLAVRPGHPLLQHKGPLGLSDVLRYPFVSTSRFPSGFLREFVSESAGGESSSRSGPRTVPSVACESVTMMRNIAQESDAVAMLPLSVLLPDLKTGAMAALPVVFPMLNTEFGIVRLAKRSLSPLGEMFVRTMLAVATEVAAKEERAARSLFGGKRRRQTSARAAANLPQLRDFSA
jgi:DNA-binding transcriptional LysR family regulator